MSDSWHKDGELDFLPKSALNPLINPLLERHLGRWAEVYFTSPPERREQAVEELLQELEKKEANGTVGIPELQPGTEVDRVSSEAEMVCTKCQHQNLAVQKFCGNCGSPLSGNMLPAAAQEPLETTSRAVPEMPSLQPATNAEESDLQWLRRKTFSQWDEIETPVRRGKKLLGAGLGLIVLLAAFGGLYWVSRDRPAPSSPASALTPPTVTQPALQPPDPSAGSIPAPQIPPVVRNRVHERKDPATQSPADASDLASVGGGSQELLLAKQSLEGKAGVRDSAAAAKLLWKAVGKKNVQAALLLSDLYVRGDGVTRNCDQARLLLVAAAKKGGTSAAQQLRSLESSGCR